MKNNEIFIKRRYEEEEFHFCDFADGGSMRKHALTWFDEGTIDAWRHRRMYQLLDPLFRWFPEANWLTIGDGRFGKDAHYLREKGLKVLATDISDVLLKEGFQMGYIDKYSKQNAEALTFSDNEFDFVLCKETYHHLPRPMIALYEMLRVAKKGVVLIEPTDTFFYSTFSESLSRLLKNILKTFLNKTTEKHRYEEVGNYIYTISKREIEKVLLGMNLKIFAYKGLNDYYICLLYTSPSPRDGLLSRMPSSA